MKINNILSLIPIGLLLIIGLGSTIQVLVTEHAFDYRQYIGLTLLFVSTLLYYKNRNLYKYIFGLTLLLGTFNLVAFSTYIIGIDLFFISIQIIPFFLLIVFSIIYKNWIINLILCFVENNEEEEQDLYQGKIKRFKENFYRLSNEKIAEKLNQELVPEARKALEEITAEREKTDYPTI